MAEFEDFRATLQRLGGTPKVNAELEALIQETAGSIESLRAVSERTLTALIESDPESIRVLGLCARLSQEQLRNVLKQWFGTLSFKRISEQHSTELIRKLDSEFGLLGRLKAERKRRWSFSDVLAERAVSRARAAGSIGRGRDVEDQVETVVKAVRLDYQMRTRFVGRGGETGPCDLAIPRGGQDALIVCAIKGFDSTGSKLTDAAAEIARMSSIRLPRQFVFAVVDGIGWLSRQSDLRRIHALWTQRSIDGLYTLSQLSQFRSDLVAAAERHGLL